MGKYRNGIETRNILLESCSKLFYEKGYVDTTVKDIVNDADSKLGLFTYYFTGKEAAALEIYREFITQFPIQLKTTMGDQYPKDLLLIDATEYRALFKCINSNPYISRFYQEISYGDAFMKHEKSIVQNFIQNLMLNCQPDRLNNRLWTPSYRQTIISLISGMEVQICRDLIENDSDTPLDEGVDLFLEEYCNLICKEPNIAKKEAEESKLLLQEYKFQVLPGFKLQIIPVNP